MKKVFFCVAAVLAIFNAAPSLAKPIDNSITGSWYNQAQSGHGLSVEFMNSNTLIIYWYVYTPDGEPTYLVTAASINGSSASGTAYIQDGMKFGEFNANDVTRTPWGTVRLTYNNCNSISLQYTSNQAAYGSGTVQMSKLAEIPGIKCRENPVHGNYATTIFNTTFGRVGTGYSFMFENGYMVWFGFDHDYGEVGIGEWQLSGNSSLSFSGYSYSMVGGYTQMSGNGQAGEQTVLNYSQGQILGSVLPSFQQATKTSDLAGNYQIRDALADQDIGSITIATDGSVQGTLSDGCSISGYIYVPNSKFNQVAVDTALTNCSNARSLSGGGMYNHNSGVLVLGVADGYTGYGILLNP